MTQSENISAYNSGPPYYYSYVNGEIQKTSSVSRCLHRIALRLKHLNATLQLLDQDLAIYRRSLKICIYKNDLEDIFKEKVYELKQIQKELKVYHLYNCYTLKVLCQDYCINHDHIDDDDDDEEEQGSRRRRTTFV